MISEIFDLFVVFGVVFVTAVVSLVDVVVDVIVADVAAAVVVTVVVESFVALVAAAVVQFVVFVVDAVFVAQVESVLSNYDAAVVSRFVVAVFVRISDVDEFDVVAVAVVDVLEIVLEIVVEYVVVNPFDLVENLVVVAAVVEYKTQEVSVKTEEEDSVDD